MLAWTKQNTMQRAMRAVLKWPQDRGFGRNSHCRTPYQPLYQYNIFPKDVPLNVNSYVFHDALHVGQLLCEVATSLYCLHILPYFSYLVNEL